MRSVPHAPTSAHHLHKACHQQTVRPCSRHSSFATVTTSTGSPFATPQDAPMFANADATAFRQHAIFTQNIFQSFSGATAFNIRHTASAAR